MGHHRGARAVRERAPAPRHDGEQRGQPPAAHRRRAQAVRDQVRAGSPRRARPGARGHPRDRGDLRRPRTSGGLALLDRVSPQPHRRPPRGSHRPLPEGRRDRREGRLPRAAGVRRVLPHARLRRVRRSPRGHRGGGTRPRGVRSPSQRVVGVPDAVRPQHGRQRAGRMAARSRVLSPRRGVRPGPRRSPAQGGRALEKRARPTSSGATSRRACAVARTRSPCRPIAVRRRDDEGDARATVSSIAGTSPRAWRSSRRASRGSGSRTSRTPTPSPRCGSSRGTCVWSARPEARALLEDVLATARDRGYPHVEGVATRLLAEACMEDDPAAAAKHFDSATALLEPHRREEPGGQGAGEAGGAPARPPEIGPARRRCWRARSRSLKRLERSTRSTGCARARTANARADSR